ncbi:MAG: ABC transporter ATP-binding protein, partial [Myxococcota bacterium]|nr:ABC transporter ATP-binding protein [Myxococcota bacterium]
IAAEGESLESAELEGRIRFEGLSFAHPSASGPGREVLRDISLEVEAGEQVLVVGPSGSGKTTLVSLIPHLSSVPRGSVFLGGRDLNDIPLKTLRSQVAFVPQDAFLFSMTVAENIGFGLDEPDNDAILAAARLAALERDMERFPQGLQTLVGERGVTLSGGQRQRMTIARAAILKPRVWVFDDCLSSVDAGTEQRIIRNLRTMTAEATAIFVTHRLLGFEGVDRVVVLQDGCITETGTHEELLALGGWYSRLYRRQKLDQDLSHGPSEPEPVEDRSW